MGCILSWWTSQRERKVPRSGRRSPPLPGGPGPAARRSRPPCAHLGPQTRVSTREAACSRGSIPHEWGCCVEVALGPLPPAHRAWASATTLLRRAGLLPAALGAVAPRAGRAQAICMAATSLRSVNTTTAGRGSWAGRWRLYPEMGLARCHSQAPAPSTALASRARLDYIEAGYRRSDWGTLQPARCSRPAATRRRKRRVPLVARQPA